MITISNQKLKCRSREGFTGSVKNSSDIEIRNPNIARFYKIGRNKSEIQMFKCSKQVN